MGSSNIFSYESVPTRVSTDASCNRFRSHETAFKPQASITHQEGQTCIRKYPYGRLGYTKAETAAERGRHRQRLERETKLETKQRTRVEDSTLSPGAFDLELQRQSSSSTLSRVKSPWFPRIRAPALQRGCRGCRSCCSLLRLA